MTMGYVPVVGYCPACGKTELELRKYDGMILCTGHPCPNPGAAFEVLQDPEIHHIVRFDSDSETFNVKHPLRERVDSELLDCDIHDEVLRWAVDGGSTNGTWRLKRRDDVPGEEANEWPWLWEKL